MNDLQIKNEQPMAYMAGEQYENEIIAQARVIIASRLKKNRQPMTSPMLVKDFLNIELHSKEREVFGVIFLDNQNKMITYIEMFQGTIDAASVYPREVIKEALKQNCVSLILAHNHPSGSSLPSEADKKITRHIQDACDLVGLRVLDHIIVGENTFSFAEAGIM